MLQPIDLSAGYGKFRPVEIVREQMHNREQIIFWTNGGGGFN